MIARISRHAMAWLATMFILAMAHAALADLNNGLIALYHFEGDVTDASGSGNSGTAVGGPLYTTGHDGQAISLDGIDDVVMLPGDLWTTSFTTAFWVRTTASAPGGTYWFQGLGMVDGEVCGSPAGGDFGIAMINGGHVISYNATTPDTINDGTYHAVVLTRSAVTDTVNTYIDGNLEISYEVPPSGLTGMPWIGVGNNPCDASFNRLYFPGEIDELHFYNRILEPSEIAELSGVVTAVGDSRSPALGLDDAFPNPFGPWTTIALQATAGSLLDLVVYDVAGRPVRSLARGRIATGSPQVFIWDGHDSAGRAVAPGVYFYRMRAGALVQTKQVVLVR